MIDLEKIIVRLQRNIKELQDLHAEGCTFANERLAQYDVKMQELRGIESAISQNQSLILELGGKIQDTTDSLDTPLFTSPGGEGIFFGVWNGMDLYFYDYGDGSVNPIVRLGNNPWDYRSQTVYNGKLFNHSQETLSQFKDAVAQARILAIAQKRGILPFSLIGGSSAFRAAVLQHGGTLDD